MNRYRLTAPALIACLSGVLSCADCSDQVECRENRDCTGHLVCINAKCGPECVTDRDCAGGTCVNKRCEVGQANLCAGVTCSGHGTCADNLGVQVCRCEQGFFPEGSQCRQYPQTFTVDAIVPASAPPGSLLTISSAFFHQGESYNVWFDQVPVPSSRVFEGSLKVASPLVDPGPRIVRVQQTDSDSMSNALVFTVDDFSFEPISKAELVGRLQTHPAAILADLSTMLTTLESSGDSPFTASQKAAIADSLEVANAFFMTAAEAAAEMTDDEARLLAGALTDSGALAVLSEIRPQLSEFKINPSESYRRQHFYMALDSLSFVLTNLNSALSVIKAGCYVGALFSWGSSFAIGLAIGSVQEGIEIVLAIINVMPADLWTLRTMRSGNDIGRIECGAGETVSIDFLGNFQGEKGPLEVVLALSLDKLVEKMFPKNKGIGEMGPVYQKIQQALLKADINLADKLTQIMERVGEAKWRDVDVPVIVDSYDYTLLELINFATGLSENVIRHLFGKLDIDADSIHLIDAVAIENTSAVSFDIDAEKFCCLAPIANDRVTFSAFRFEEIESVPIISLSWFETVPTIVTVGVGEAPDAGVDAARSDSGTDGGDRDAGVDSGTAVPICARGTRSSSTRSSYEYVFCDGLVDGDPRGYTWDEARSECLSWGGDLLWVADGAEWSFVTDSTANHLWIGLNDRVAEGDFVWSSGSPVTYVNWSSGEPSGGTTENCAESAPDLGNRWVDRGCATAKHGFACKRGSVTADAGAHDATSGSWQQLTPTTAPEARHSHSMAYDENRNRVVLFGGYEAWDSRTWEFDGVDWQQIATVSSPSARAWHAMVFDSGRNCIVLFGGRDGGLRYLQDTWEYDGTNWTMRSVVSPPSKFQHAMAYDAVRERVVLFGGRDSSRTAVAETWEFDGTEWLQLIPVDSPGPKYGHSMVFDRLRNRTVLFGGGFDGHGMDTWEFDGTNWREIAPVTTPTARYGHAMVYDSDRSRVVLFGGERDDLGRTRLADSWAYDGSSWSRLNPTSSASPRSEHAMSFDSATGLILLFGGDYGGSSRLGDTWTFAGY